MKGIRICWCRQNYVFVVSADITVATLVAIIGVAVVVFVVAVVVFVVVVVVVVAVVVCE